MLERRYIEAMDLYPTMSATMSTVNIVTGLPRSGTSMLMNVLKAGGMDLYTDGVRQSDSRNPNGYYELEATKDRLSYAEWSENAIDKVVKVVTPLLHNLPSTKIYNVIYILRNMDAVIQSQTDMADHYSKSSWNSETPKQLHSIYNNILEESKRWLQSRPNIRTLYLQYEEILANPDIAVKEICKFLNYYTLESENMIQAIKPELNHHKKKATLLHPAVDPIKAIIFDLDGVLIDSEKVMYLSYINSFKKFLPNESPPDFSEYCKYLGQRLSDIINQMGLPPEMESAFVEETYNNIDEINLFDGVKDLLEKLSALNIPIAIATGKDSDRTEVILKHLGIRSYFEIIMCSDLVDNPKPAPEMANIIINKWNLPARNVLFVGDAIADIKCGQSAGTKTAVATWGDPHKSVFEMPTNFQFKNPTEILSLFHGPNNA
ncbi:MAG: HAD-IA family hydrolase [Gammaproteobacteria bacterium]|nr:HAD-IA family hydrolase [Gammaproteobacteria bacterium]